MRLIEDLTKQISIIHRLDLVIRIDLNSRQSSVINTCERIVPNKIEVELPASFASKLGDNKYLFNRVFSSESKSGGGAIDDLVYMPEQLKAIITYNQEWVAQNVLSKKEIAYCDHVFRVKNCVEIARLPPIESTMEQIEPRPRAEVLNYQKLILKGVLPTKNAQKVHGMAYFITKSNPVSCKLKNALQGEWLLSFKENLDFAGIDRMFKKRILPAGLSYEVVYEYSEANGSPYSHFSVAQPAKVFQSGRLINCLLDY